VLVMLGGFWLYERDQRQQRDVKALKEENEKLKEANRRRMPYLAYEHLLDAMAAIDAEEREVEIKRVFLDNAKAHMTQAMQAGTKDK
jgi:hypothetical protein